MASSKDFLEFVLGQLSMLPDITYRAMMGEFIIYYHGKIIGGIYDNRLLVKPTESILKIIPHATMEIPYDGGRPMIMIPDVENSELLTRVFNKLYDELPALKKKK
ncbi:MAG: TfoX/Sxy family protein [Alphaproteobacteria bacterium]|nr:TfoX/Sxy family protein [Alphaproteobacteria bacterium]